MTAKIAKKIQTIRPTIFPKTIGAPRGAYTTRG
jgi:hypothetical protein